jgi:hypothetical protein
LIWDGVGDGGPGGDPVLYEPSSETVSHRCECVWANPYFVDYFQVVRYGDVDYHATSWTVGLDMSECIESPFK